MIVMPWETAIQLAVLLLVVGFVLALAMGVIQVRGLKKEAKTVTIPENDEEAVLQALNVVEHTNEKFFQAFEKLSNDGRIGLKGIQIAHICDRLFKAREQVEDAWTVARGSKMVTLADPETRAYTLELAEIVDNLDAVIVAGPNFKVEPEPTRH
jgi:hypothetical protein